jgi:hypothetical protein
MERKCVCGEDLPERPDRSCGVRVCGACGHHQGLVRCYCGWSATGGDGRRELEEAGETIDEDV